MPRKPSSSAPRSKSAKKKPRPADGVSAKEIVWSTHATQVWTGQVPTRCGWCGKNSMYQSIAWPMHFCCANCHPGIENDPRWRFPGKTNVAGEFVPRPE